MIDYFTAHPEFALGAVFVAALLESLAVIGTIVPGSSIVFAGGMLVGLKALDPWHAAVAAIMGAILGDGISFELGRRYHDQIRSMWPARNYPALFERGQAYFAAHGGRSVFLGRFLGPLRAIVPVIAGMANMPPAHFFAMNVLSALAWAAAHLLPGVLFGASLQIAGAISSRLVVLIATVVAAVWLLTHVIRLAVRIGMPYVRMIQDRLVTQARERPGRLANLVLPLLDPARPESVSLLVAATLLIGGAWLFLGVVEDVVTKDTLVEVDRSIYEWLQAIRTGWGDDIMVTVTALGSAFVTIAVIIAVASWLGVTRHWRTLAYWLTAVAFAELLVWALKNGFERARPETRYAEVDLYALPSGHAALSIVVYGFLAFLLAHGKPGWQKIAVALPAAVMAVLIAFSRLYLGVHWFSDVAASVGLGLAWIGLLCIAYINHVHERPLRALPLLVIVFTTLTFFGTAYANRYHDRDLRRYARPVDDANVAPRPMEERRMAKPVRRAFRVARTAGGALRGAVGRHTRQDCRRAGGVAMAETRIVGFERDTPLVGTHDAARRAAGVAEVQPGTAAGADVRATGRFAQPPRDPPLASCRGQRCRAPAQPAPLWSGILTANSRRTEFGLIGTARDDERFRAPASRRWTMQSVGRLECRDAYAGRSPCCGMADAFMLHGHAHSAWSW